MAHNAPFDLRFLNYERRRLAGRYFTQPWLDTLVLARRLLNGQGRRHDLATLAVVGRHHRAARSTARCPTPRPRPRCWSRCSACSPSAASTPWSGRSPSRASAARATRTSWRWPRTSRPRRACTSCATATGGALYVGKAANLRRRVRSYFGPGRAPRAAHRAGARGAGVDRPRDRAGRSSPPSCARTGSSRSCGRRATGAATARPGQFLKLRGRATRRAPLRWCRARARTGPPTSGRCARSAWRATRSPASAPSTRWTTPTPGSAARRRAAARRCRASRAALGDLGARLGDGGRRGAPSRSTAASAPTARRARCSACSAALVARAPRAGRARGAGGAAARRRAGRTSSSWAAAWCATRPRSTRRGVGGRRAGRGSRCCAASRARGGAPGRSRRTRSTRPRSWGTACEALRGSGAALELAAGWRPPTRSPRIGRAVGALAVAPPRRAGRGAARTEPRAAAALALSGRYAPIGRQAAAGLRGLGRRRRARACASRTTAASRSAAPRSPPGLARAADLLFGPYGSGPGRARRRGDGRRGPRSCGTTAAPRCRAHRGAHGRRARARRGSYWRGLPDVLRRPAPTGPVAVVRAPGRLRRRGRRPARPRPWRPRAPGRSSRSTSTRRDPGAAVAAARAAGAAVGGGRRADGGRPGPGASARGPGLRLALVVCGVAARRRRAGRRRGGWLGPVQWDGDRTRAGRSRPCPPGADYPAAQALAAGMLAERALALAGGAGPDALWDAARALRTATPLGPFAVDARGPPDRARAGHRALGAGRRAACAGAWRGGRPPGGVTDCAP